MKLVLVIKGLLVAVSAATFLLFPSDTCKQGVVVDKLHVPAHEKEIDSYSIQMDAPMKETLKFSEKNLLVIQDKKKECICKVSKHTFEQVMVGDTFTIQTKLRIAR